MLFDRATFKTNAKTSLRRFYGWALLATLIIAVLGGANGALGVNSNASFSVSLPMSAIQSITDSINGVPDAIDSGEHGSASAGVGETIDIPDEPQSSTPDTTFSEFMADDGVIVLLAMSVIFLFVTGIGIVFQLFVSNPLEVGYRRFFLSARENDANLGDLFWSYSHNLGKSMGTLFLRSLYLALWEIPMVIVTTAAILLSMFGMSSDGSAFFSSALFPVSVVMLVLAAFACAIPVIIKNIQYSMLSYLLAENPQMGHKRAFELTKAMTTGYKWKLFVLDLSFIGWQILGALCCGIGGLFLAPYIQATKAEAYTFLKARAIEGGIANAEEFPGFDITALVEAASEEYTGPAEY